MVRNVSFIVFLEEIRRESPKDATKKVKLHSKLNLEVITQANPFQTREKIENSRIKLKNSASHYSLVAEKWPKNKPAIT